MGRHLFSGNYGVFVFEKVDRELLKFWSSNGCLENVGVQLENSNFRLCVDGARRGGGKASAGMALMVCNEDGIPTVLCRGGLLLSNTSSAFLAEMLAMEWALEWFRDCYA